jgi:Cofilin/tropomyosin-type actin-binding protein
MMPPSNHRCEAPLTYKPIKQDQIDKKTMEIKPVDDEVYTNMQELADELPEHNPRFILLSYPLTLVRPPRPWILFAERGGRQGP